MNCKIQLRCLNLHDPIEANRAFFLSILISDIYHFRTIQHRSVDKRIPICQQLELQLNQELQFYAKIDLCELVGTKQEIIDSKVFYSAEIQKLQKHEFKIPTGSHKKTTTATLDCSIFINNAKINEENKNLLERLDRFGKRLKQQIHDIKEQTPISNMEMLKIGEQSYHFTNRLDNVIKIRNLLVAYRDWVNPKLTLFVTFMLSFVIFSPRMAIAIICISMVIFKDYFIKILADFSNSLQFPHKRLILPAHNVLFLKQFFDTFCNAFDRIKSVMVDPQKVEFKIIITKLISKLWIPILVVFFLSIKEILVIALWMFVLGRHYRAAQVIRSLNRLINYLITQLQTRLHIQAGTGYLPISLNISEANTYIQEQKVKTLFVYQYQRQWFGKFNTKDTKIADESGHIKLNKQKFPHPLYEWIDEWKLVIDAQTDAEGYTYSADIVHKYHKQRNLLDALRRRKWVRKCQLKMAEDQQFVIKGQSVFKELDALGEQQSLISSQLKKTQ